MARRSTATPAKPPKPMEPLEAEVLERPPAGAMVPADRGGQELGVAEGLENVGTAMAHRSVEEIRGMITVAKAHPRSEDKARQKLARTCQSPQFCQDAVYAFEVGGKTVTGPTIKAAKEVARIWTNMIYGAVIIADTPDSRTLRCWAWDLEDNVRDELDTTFRKIIGRKQGPGKPLLYRAPTDVELRVLTNAEGSRGVRNCILNLLPYDVRETMMGMIQETRNKRITENPEAFTNWLIEEFGKLHVPIEELEAFTGQPVRQSNTAQLDFLDKVRAGIANGEQTWAAWVGQKAAKEGVAGDAPPKSAAELRGRVNAKAEGIKKKLAAGENVETPPTPATSPATPAAAEAGGKKKGAGKAGDKAPPDAKGAPGVESTADGARANGNAAGPPRLAPEGYSDPEPPPIPSDQQ